MTAAGVRRTAAVRRVVPLTFGWEHIPQSISITAAEFVEAAAAPVG